MAAVELGLPAVRAAGQVAPEHPRDRLVDGFGRVARDLRVSLTDRCNLRCTYCMPADGLEWLPTADALTDDELLRLITIAVRDLGVTELRFTGGEPLLRRGLEGIVARTAELRTTEGRPPSISLTTNGLGLAHRAAGLAAAGLTRVNVSLDSLDPERYARLTRRDRLPDVIAGLAAARAAGLAPIKLNAVMMRGVNDDEPVSLVRWALAEGYRLRFIEQMPLGPHGSWERSGMVTAAEILARLGSVFDLEPEAAARRGSAPAELWTVREDGRAVGTVGVIASVTHPFCGDCDRVRLTADGQMRDCLFARHETDLRALVRGGAQDREIADAWAVAMLGKRAGHGIDDPGFLQPDRPMSAIGG